MAWSYDQFANHELESMEMWERFILGDARVVAGTDEASALALKAAYAQPLTPERVKELISLKGRLEAEEVPPRYIKRDIKHGHGSLDDINWFVHVLEMRYPTATKAGTLFAMESRIRELARARLINTVEAEELLEARVYLLDMRHKLALLGIEGSVLPENPDKLERLAAQLGVEDGNALLRRHENVVRTVRAIFSEGLERLKI
jgi:glutamate-ammonia-ligase adenylyltransferase